MVFSYYLLKPPYNLVWYFKKLIGGLQPAVFYAANYLDCQIFAPVQAHLKPIPVVAKNKKVQQSLLEHGIKSKVIPVFAKAVIMCRHDAWRFPVNSMVKIGMRHGAYHFKAFTSAKNYHQFTRFLVTSPQEAEEAAAVGINNACGVGFPKLDQAFNGQLKQDVLNKLKAMLQLDQNKPTVLFTATWDQSGMSALPLWYHRLAKLTNSYNVLVTLHPWVSQQYKQVIVNTPGVKYISDLAAVISHIMLADVCVGDTSSVLAECCALDKPLITFDLPAAGRTVPEVIEMLKNISIRVNNFDELQKAIATSLQNPGALAMQRQQANKRMFGQLDGQAGKRAAQQIIQLLPQLAPNS